MTVHVVWAGASKRGISDVVPVIKDNGEAVLPDEAIDRLRNGETASYDENDFVAKFVVEAALADLESETTEEAPQ